MKDDKELSEMLEESEKQYEYGQIYKAREVFEELRIKYGY